MRRARTATHLAAAAFFVACGSDQGPVIEQPIDGSWILEGLFQYDVEATVQCRWSGTIDIQQLPGGVNTVVGSGTYEFDCLTPGPPLATQVTANLMNAGLTGTDFAMTFGGCSMGAQYERTRPSEIHSGRAFCRMNFPGIPPIDVAGAWRARRATP